MNNLGIVFIAAAIVWVLTFLPAWWMLIRLIASATAPDFRAERARFVMLFVVYRLLIVAPYVVLLVFGGEQLGPIVNSVIVGFIVTGLALSVVRFFARRGAIHLLWNIYANVYDGLRHLYPYQHMLDLMRERANVRAGMQVLDLGCGTGNLLAQFADARGVDLYGVDASPNMLERIRPKIRHAKSAPRIVQADVVTFLRSRPNISADVITLSNVLYAVEDREKLWVELLRVVKSSGKIVITNSDRGGSLPIIKEQIAHGSFWQLLRPSVVLVGVIDSLISAFGSSGKFAFISEARIRHEVTRAGGKVSDVERCYGGTKNGVNILFTVTRA